MIKHNSFKQPEENSRVKEPRDFLVVYFILTYILEGIRFPPESKEIDIS